MQFARSAGPLALAIAAAMTLAACGGEEKKVEPRPTLTVTAARVTETALPRTVDVSGTIAAWQEVPVGAEAGGLEAAQVLADEGQYVRQGQLLVKLNDRLLRAQVASAQATVNQMNNALARARELNERGFLSRAALDTAVANQATAAAALSEARARLDQTNIRAPVSGLITARSVVKGQIVSAGTELFRLVREGQIELNAQVPEAELRLVRPGQSATVTGEGKAAVTGRVRIVTPQVDPQTRLGLARISLPEVADYQPGNFARASIDVGAAPAMVVPSNAIVFREGRSGVYVIDASSKVRFVPVRTGERVGAMVEVEQGLTPGQRIAVQGAGFLAEGNLVRVGPAAGAAAAPKAAPRAADAAK